MTRTGGTVLQLPEPALVVLIGAAGAGKSTLAARLFPADAILSSDGFREVVAGNAADQGATKTAFAILHRQLERRLATARTTVVDATSVTPASRRGLLRRAAAHGVPSVALVLNVPRPLVIARNASRAGRVVPEAAVLHQLADLSATMLGRTLEEEGFAAIHVIRTATELDALRLAPPER